MLFVTSIRSCLQIYRTQEYLPGVILRLWDLAVKASCHGFCLFAEELCFHLSFNMILVKNDFKEISGTLRKILWRFEKLLLLVCETVKGEYFFIFLIMLLNVHKSRKFKDPFILKCILLYSTYFMKLA